MQCDARVLIALKPRCANCEMMLARRVSERARCEFMRCICRALMRRVYNPNEWRRLIQIARWRDAQRARRRCAAVS